MVELILPTNQKRHVKARTIKLIYRFAKSNNSISRRQNAKPKYEGWKFSKWAIDKKPRKYMTRCTPSSKTCGNTKKDRIRAWRRSSETIGSAGSRWHSSSSGKWGGSIIREEPTNRSGEGLLANQQGGKEIEFWSKCIILPVTALFVWGHNSYTYLPIILTNPIPSIKLPFAQIEATTIYIPSVHTRTDRPFEAGRNPKF